MTRCNDRKCGSDNTIRINPTGTIPKYKCMTCNGPPFIEQKDRIAICSKITRDDTSLRGIDEGVINRRIIAFWAETDNFGKHLKAFIEENDSDFLRRVTPATTVDRDYRRKTSDNEDGLNATYRKEDSKIAA